MTGAALFILAVLAVMWLVRLSEAQLAFFPLKGEDATPATFGIPFTPLIATTADGERIRIWRLPRDGARAQVVYFHGNGGNLSLWADVLVELWRRGFDVVAFDYRGYGRSSGRPSEAGIYKDTDALLALLPQVRRAHAPLLYWGRSLGGTVAAYAATRREPDGIVIEAGFPSMRSVLESNPPLWLLSWFSRYQFPTARWMQGVRAPALVLHGDRDSVIPYHLGQRLYAAIPGQKRFVTIDGGDHNDPAPRDPDSYWRAVVDFVQSTRR